VETIAYIPPSIFAAVRSTVNQEGGNPQPLETFPIPPEVKSIFSDSNMEIQIQMYGNLFVSITLINHGYASILIPFEPRSRYKVIPRLTVPAGTTCDKPKIVLPSPSKTEFLCFVAKIISGTQEFYPTALTSSNNFLLKRYSGQHLRIILSNFTAGDDDYLLLGDKCRGTSNCRKEIIRWT